MKTILIIVGITLVCLIGFGTIGKITDSITETRTSMWILLSGNLLNIIGNYVLIYGKAGMPEMGVL